ncbi:lactoylglutathione lyase-like protein [Mycena albidolilacea]|uniref:Lactoylglutathione lyase n=1 Tax=Mycena albidolilacea TaxID=1033008 RepID=A0AAD7F466_9AGAR|nr:lactoylglutathione lyase-like protein [Mycena albidolilacea]
MATDTTKYKFNHSMLRVKDPKESVKFYEFLGMKLINKIENPDAKFDLYFLAYDSPSAVSHGKHWTDREGIIELTHNYGTESDPEYKIVNGNTEPHRGFGHVCVSVDNIQAARNSPTGACDWVEVISLNSVEATAEVKETSVEKYRMNHTMIRVKDHEKSLAFYQDVMGMKLKRTSENPSAKFNLYFLGYGPAAPKTGGANGNPIADSEGLLELTWNYGTESDPEFKYHNGNDQPQGFGHICVSVDDLDAACARFEEKGVSWKKRLTEGRMKNIAFVLDPDNYWIEVIQNEGPKTRTN